MSYEKGWSMPPNGEWTEGMNTMTILRFVYEVMRVVDNSFFPLGPPNITDRTIWCSFSDEDGVLGALTFQFGGDKVLYRLESERMDEEDLSSMVYAIGDHVNYYFKDFF